MLPLWPIGTRSLGPTEVARASAGTESATAAAAAALAAVACAATEFDSAVVELASTVPAVVLPQILRKEPVGDFIAA